MTFYTPSTCYFPLLPHYPVLVKSFFSLYRDYLCMHAICPPFNHHCVCVCVCVCDYLTSCHKVKSTISSWFMTHSHHEHYFPHFFFGLNHFKITQRGFSFIIILGERVSLFPLENVIKTFFLPILNFKKKKKIVEIGNI